MSSEHEPPAWLGLQRAIIGYRLTSAIAVAARLAVAGHLRDGPRAPAELAAATGSDADALARVLRLLASEGIFREDGAGRFGLTPMAELLRSDVPGSMRQRALIEAEEWSRPWFDLGHTVATGEPAFARSFGAPLFDYYAARPDAAARFDATMTSMTTHVTPALVDALDLPETGTVVDVGGGRGTLMAAMLRARPGLRGVLYDLPHVVQGAAALLDGLGDRCDIVGGDFFEAVPPGGDVYVLKFIVVDWEPERALLILRNCRRAMAAGARVAVVEMVLRPGNAPFYGRWTDVNMMVLLGGRERTEDEYRSLLREAGLDVTRVVPTASDFGIVEAVAAV